MLRIVRPLVRLRSAILSAIALGGGLILLLTAGATRERTTALVILAMLAAAIAAVDRPRLRNSRKTEFRLNPALELSVALVAQTTMIFLTGLVESPFLVVLVITSLIAGLALGTKLGGLGIALGASASVWVIAILSRYAEPTWPAFFNETEAGGIPLEDTLVRAAFTQLFIAITFILGTRVHRSILRMLDEALHVREQLVVTLAERNQELLKMSGAIAHELKNPLASIQGLVQLIERGDENRKKRFEVLTRELHRMKSTVDEFLSFSRPIDPPSLELIDPRSVFDELSSIHEGLLTERRLSLEVKLSLTEPVRADPQKLRQALSNLLHNAIEASPEGGQLRWVAKESEGLVRLGVVDSGPGIDAELLERIGRVGVTTKKHGSGIGLVVCRAIAEQHGGRLVFERERDGFLVAIELPREPSTGS
ncbi:MAG: HAMP domain-containing histidine kinase [Deltaproteobacteria bacterium]|nr:HAMP domain-containing histidine kinase [Deltaproteobacteria bacterium]